MKVILTADVKKVGRKGEVKEVSSGYAQNVLLPQKLALPGTPENLEKVQKEAERKEDKKAFNEGLLIKALKEIDGRELVIPANANEQGTLFKAIHTQQIIEALKKEFNVEVPETVFQESISIKQSGQHKTRLKAGKVHVDIVLNVGNQ